ncbi:MAG: flagellar motor switch protein FliN [Propionibacteriales bacterium]|nr:flagellar motor switch protein FliN [Propionibacteriales bacterium]
MTTSPSSSPVGADLALAAASAAATVLPSVETLTAAGAQPGGPEATAGFAGAVVADLDGAHVGRIAVLVGEELTTALAASPIEGLDLAAAVQPALDVVAATLGSVALAARSVELDLVASDLGPSFTVVPLIGSGISAAVLMQDQLLDPRPEVEPVGVLPRAATGSTSGSTVEEPVTAPAAAPVTPLPRRGIEMLHGVDMEVTVELGRTRMTVRDLLALTPGAVLELDRAAGSPADLLVNGRLIARGEVVVVDEDFGLRVTEILDDSAAV